MATADYTDDLLTFMRRSVWVKIFVGIEVLLLGGGYLLAELGENNTAEIGAEVDPLKAAGGLAGGLAIIFAAIAVVVIVGLVAMHIQEHSERQVEF